MSSAKDALPRYCFVYLATDGCYLLIPVDRCQNCAAWHEKACLARKTKGEDELPLPDYARQVGVIDVTFTDPVIYNGGAHNARL